MRLIDLGPSSAKQPFPLVAVALGDSDKGNVCYHYRTTHDHGSSMDIDGLEIVFASDQVAGGKEPDGLTIDCLLAICEDQARHQVSANNRMNLVAMQLQAARRALATDESNKPNHLISTGTSSKNSAIVDAPAVETEQGE